MIMNSYDIIDHDGTITYLMQGGGGIYYVKWFENMAESNSHHCFQRHRRVHDGMVRSMVG